MILLDKKKAIILLLLCVGIIVYFLFNPETANFFPPCPFTYLTGLQCPGCGSQRAIHNLLHLNISRAFYFNPLLVVTFPYVLSGVYFEYFGGKEKYPKARKFLFGKTAITITFVVVIVYWILRNVI